MFKKNDEHRLYELFSHYRPMMKPNIAKMLDNTWAPVFYKEVFRMINEEFLFHYTALITADPTSPSTYYNGPRKCDTILQGISDTNLEVN